MTDTERGRDDARTDSQDAPAFPRLATLTAFQRDLLWTLAHDAPLKGLAVKRALEAYYDEPVNHSRIYPNLDELAARGLVEKGKRDERTNEYRLTEDGRRALSLRQAWTEGGTDTDR